MSQRRSALLVWIPALLIYITAIAGRTSFGIASLNAAERFEVNAATLSMFTVIQVGVYALAQIPVGVLLDRVGSRKVLVGGAVLLAAGQIGLAVAESLGWALAVRVLIGLGDATAFTAVLRLLPFWFAPRRVPTMVQLTSILGQFGQVVSSLPFAFVLARVGWTPAFSSIAVLGLFVATIGWFLIRDEPEKPATAEASRTAGSERAVKETASDAPVPSVRETLENPGPWLGFWTHWSGSYPNMMFTLLWGVPFLQIHNGMSQTAASATLLINTVAGILIGPVIGELTARFPARRALMVQGASVVILFTWMAVLLVPAPAPTWLIWVLLVTLALAGSTSSIGFDFTRTSVHPQRYGTANGLVNMGGFIATLIVAYIVGVALDFSAGGAPLSATDFKVAMAVQFAVWLPGVFFVHRAHRRSTDPTNLAIRKWASTERALDELGLLDDDGRER